MSQSSEVSRMALFGYSQISHFRKNGPDKGAGADADCDGDGDGDGESFFFGNFSENEMT